MLFAIAVAALVAVFQAPIASATALTYNMDANEQACFYTWVDAPGKKIAFYFAVQSGGAFDIDYAVTKPSGQLILDGEKEKQGDYVFTANDVGEYEFCFSNQMSAVAEKVVDFEIHVEDEQRAELPTKGQNPPEQTSNLEESIMKISSQLSTISRNQKYFRTRENRNFSTVRSTESRIFWFSLSESLMMITMSCLEVFIVRTFFSTRTKTGV